MGLLFESEVFLVDLFRHALDLHVAAAQDFQLHRLSGSAAGIMSAVTFLGKPEDEVLQAVQRLVACVTAKL